MTIPAVTPDTEVRMDASFYAEAIYSLKKLRAYLTLEDFVSFYNLFRPVKAVLASMRDQVRGHQRYALCYIHDAFVYSPTYAITPDHLDVLLGVIGLMIDDIVGPSELEIIYWRLINSGFDILPPGKSVGKTTDTDPEEYKRNLAEIEKRLSKVISSPMGQIAVKIESMLEEGTLSEHDFCGLPGDWLYFKKIISDWEREMRGEST